MKGKAESKRLGSEKRVFPKEGDDEMVGLNYNFNVLEILNDLARSGAKISTPHFVKSLKLQICLE